MKNFYIVLLALFFTTLSFSKNDNNIDVFITEINYAGDKPFIELDVIRNNEMEMFG